MVVAALTLFDCLALNCWCQKEYTLKVKGKLTLQYTALPHTSIGKAETFTFESVFFSNVSGCDNMLIFLACIQNKAGSPHVYCSSCDFSVSDLNRVLFLFDQNVTFTLLSNTKAHPCLNYLLQKVTCNDIIYIDFISIFIYINWSVAYF